MTAEIKGITYELKFTFNSFKYMEDFNVNDLQMLETSPFRIVPLVEMLLLGALNHNPKTRISVVDVDEYLESYITENSIAELAEELIALLEDSNFFKSLQKEPSKKSK